MCILIHNCAHQWWKHPIMYHSSQVGTCPLNWVGERQESGRETSFWLQEAIYWHKNHEFYDRFLVSPLYNWILGKQYCTQLCLDVPNLLGRGSRLNFDKKFHNIHHWDVQLFNLKSFKCIPWWLPNNVFWYYILDFHSLKSLQMSIKHIAMIVWLSSTYYGQKKTVKVGIGLTMFTMKWRLQHYWMSENNLEDFWNLTAELLTITYQLLIITTPTVGDNTEEHNMTNGLLSYLKQPQSTNIHFFGFLSWKCFESEG